MEFVAGYDGVETNEKYVKIGKAGENLQGWRAANPKYPYMTYKTYMDYGKITASHSAWPRCMPASSDFRRLK